MFRIRGDALIKHQSAAAIATALLALGLGAAPAYAGTAGRAWVSGHGADAAGCGSPAAPCRSLQYVVTNVIAAGGEIDVLDPSGYGAVTIPFALSIVNDGAGTAGVQQGAAGQSGITINAGPTDAITLRGLNIDGLGTGRSGVQFNSGGSLTVVNCVVEHFTGSGNAIRSTSGSESFVISNVIAEYDTAGINIAPLSGAPITTGVIDHVIASNDTTGINDDSSGATGGALNVAITNSIASNNSQDGVFTQNGGGASVTFSIDSSTLSGNGTGVEAEHTSTVLLGRNVITSNNTFGVFNGTTSNTVYTYGNNSINGNAPSDVSGTLNTAFHLQ